MGQTLTLHGRPDGPRALRVCLDGIERPARIIARNGRQSWRLPEACLTGREHLHIALATDRTIEAAHFNPKDDRILGIALARLAIRSD